MRRLRVRVRISSTMWRQRSTEGSRGVLAATSAQRRLTARESSHLLEATEAFDTVQHRHNLLGCRCLGARHGGCPAQDLMRLPRALYEEITRIVQDGAAQPAACDNQTTGVRKVYAWGVAGMDQNGARLSRSVGGSAWCTRSRQRSQGRSGSRRRAR